MKHNNDKGRFQTRGIAILSAGHAIHDSYGGFLPALLPKLIEKLAISNTDAGLLAVIMQLPALLQPLIGHIAEKVKLRYFFILAPAATGIMMSLVGVMPSYGLIVLVLLVAGISSACVHAVGPVMTGRIAGNQLGRGMGFWMVGGELGRTIGPLVAVSAVSWLTLSGTPILCTGGIATSAILYFRLKDTPGRPSDEPSPLPWRNALRIMAPIMLPLTGLMLCRSFLIAALTTYLPTFLNQEGASLIMAGASLSILEGAGILGAISGGIASDRFGRRPVIVISIVVPAVLTFIFLSVTGWLQIVLLIGMGFFALSIGASLMALVQETFPENRVLANGVFMALSFSVRSVGVILVGLLSDQFGLKATYLLCCGVPLLGLPLIFLLPKRVSRPEGSC